MSLPTLRLHVFQHIRGEDPLILRHWAAARHAQMTVTAFDDWREGQPLPLLPNIDDVDLLVVMGGAMSVNDVDRYPWLHTEKHWINTFIQAGQPVVGLCLGAQLIASAMGATVRRSLHTEIGWWPIAGLPTDPAGSSASRFRFPPHLTALSWHSDTFDLPQSAVRLAHSAACPQQAYQLGDRVLAFQFHPESTPASLALFLADDGYQDLVIGPYIQTEAQLRSAPIEQYLPANQLLKHALDFVIRPIPTA
jgi:GMP synthase-like glutamine amidotransferase